MNRCFPNFGQVVKFAFAALGLLPRKRGACDGLTEQEKKRIQKQVERLVDEEGALQERCGELISSLAFITAGTISNLKVNFAIGDLLMDLLDVYTDIIRSDGTYLSKRDNIQWFCSCYAIQRLVFSIQKHLMRYNLAGEALDTPHDPDWYLPTLVDGKPVWPLEKAMRWVYYMCDTSQTRFHFPDKDAQVDDPCQVGQKQNLENAAGWLNSDGSCPSWPALHWNFSTSLERLGNVAEPRFQRLISPQRRESILIVLFLARVATYVCKAISTAYGQAYLMQLVNRGRRQRAWLCAELAPVNGAVEAYLSGIDAPPERADAFWWDHSKHYWHWLSGRAIEVGEKLHRLRGNEAAPIADDTVAALVAQYGEYPVRAAMEQFDALSDFPVPAGLPQAVLDGLELRSRQSLEDNDIDRYAQRIAGHGIAQCIPWMEAWLRACIRYRSGEYEAAFGYMEQAFQHAKYCAGQRQYELVNQYIELAAKTDRWKCFKKGIDWATYLGIPVRWLRDDEPTTENLRMIFKWMKKVQYRM